MSCYSAFCPPAKVGGKNVIGSSRENYWKVEKSTVDMTTDHKSKIQVTLTAQPQNVIFDLNQSALVIVDMQNDFCAKGGWVDTIGGDFSKDRLPIKPISLITPELRKFRVPIIWLNWGNRPDLLNMAPNQFHLYSPDGEIIGLGEAIPGSGSKVLEKDSWSAEVVDDLLVDPMDIQVDKYRISGFWDTPLDSILRNLNVRTLLFAGVNIDQCVMCTLQDANFLGYGCVLLQDCCSTTSPDFCTDATLWNIKNCFGFVSSSSNLMTSLGSL